MPQWAGSCWYYLRYLDPGHETALADPQIERYWTSPSGVDLYVGGVEHAVLGGHRAAAAPDHRRGPGGLRRAALPHRDRADHRADRARVPAAVHAPCALAEPLVLMVAPLAPHLAEELWQRLGHPGSLAYEPFPQADPALAAAATVTLPVQVNGKVRFTIEVPATATRDDIAGVLASHPAYPRDAWARIFVASLSNIG